MPTDLERYIEACNYPGVLDETAVTRSLQAYCKALGVKREVRRIQRPWWRDEHLLSTVIGVARLIKALDALDARGARAARDARDARAASAARDARAARDALDARAARDASAALQNDDWAIRIREFGNWCIHRGGWCWWELSFLASIHLGALQTRSQLVQAWTGPLMEAHCAGGWNLFWTEEALYWTSKPRVSVERGSFGRRLHCEDGPACANDVENLHFLHGVLMPAYAVVQPESITVQEIKAETNQEVRRLLIEQFGWDRYLSEAGATVIDRRKNDVEATLEALAQCDGETLLICACPSTARRYALRVPQQIKTCEQAQSWLSGGLSHRVINAA
jgi:hypothetical protein